MIFLSPSDLDAAVRGKIDDRLCWPPVFERTFGTPTVSVKCRSRKAGILFIRPLQKVVVRLPEGKSEGDPAIDDLLCEYFLNQAWERFFAPESFTKTEQRLNMEEVLPLSRGEFMRIGRAQLMRRGSQCGSADEAWWKVRMGCDLTPSRDHLMVLNSLAWAERDWINPGHFSLAIRKRGGAPREDFIFDFRAPWPIDRRTEISDAFSLPKPWIMKIYRENYYDWLDTQTQVRNCHVISTFLPVSEEQVELLRAFNEKHRDTGHYEAAKTNCATLGVQFVNRILPVDRRIPREFTLVDLPNKKIKTVSRALGGEITTLRLDSESMTNDRKFTHKNATQPAWPSRTKCRSFQACRNHPRIN